jgi:hypothetical protein
MRFVEWLAQFETVLLEIASLYRENWEDEDEWDDEDRCSVCGDTSDELTYYDPHGWGEEMICPDCKAEMPMTRERAFSTREFAFDHLFPPGEDRIYLPFTTTAKEGEGEMSGDDNDVIQTIEEFKGGGKYPESPDGYEVVDYIKGLAAPKTITKKDQWATPDEMRAALKAKGVPDTKIEKAVIAKFGLTEGERPLFKIKGILQSMANEDMQGLDGELASGKISQRKYDRQAKRSKEWYEELIFQFEHSPARQGKGAEVTYTVVISRKPEDIENMSTGRSWTSCMDLSGSGGNEDSIYCEVQGGGFIAYLTTPDDKNLERPKARVLIRRFDPKNGGRPVAIPEDSVYGWDVPGFVDFVKRWLDSKQGSVTPGFYKRKGGEYSDTFGDEELVTPEGREDLWQWVDQWGQLPDDETAMAQGQAAAAKLLEIDKETPLSDEEAAKLLPYARMLPSYSYAANLKTLLKNHPALASDDDLQGMSTTDLNNVFPNLPPQQQAVIRKQVYDHLMANLVYPSPLMKPDEKGESPYSEVEFGVSRLFTDLLDQATIFRPIPDPLVKKMIDLAKSMESLPLTKRLRTQYVGAGPTGKVTPDGEIEDKIINHIAHVLSLTHTDTPRALEFFRHRLAQQGEKGFDFSNAQGYNSWFSAVGGLGAQGQEFLPQLQRELERNTQELRQAQEGLAQAEQEIAAGNKDAWKQKHELERRIYQLQRSEEEYNWAIDAITSGKGRSDKYDPWS